MDIININAQEYYLVNDAKKTHPQLFRGTRTNLELINKYKLTLDNEYIYARLDKTAGEWVLSNKRSKALDKLLLLKSWIESTLGLVNDKIAELNSKYLPLPPLIKLTDDEKIKDDEGNVYEIEVRGEREENGCFFKVKDVSAMLEMPKLSDNILCKNTLYIKGEDYVTFVINSKCNDSTLWGGNILPKPTNNKSLYLTYHGFIRVLYVSRNSRVRSFISWANRVIYTAHLGTKVQKQELAANFIGTSREIVRQVFSKSATSQSCIYLIYLGKARDLANKFKVKDYKHGQSIYKFGRTINLSKRIDQHYAKYSKLGCDVRLTIFANIDPIYNNDAENDIKAYFIDNEYKLSNKKYVELVSINDEELELVTAKYKEISGKYMGHYTELNNQIKVMEQKCRADIAEKDNELLNNNLKAKDIIHKYEVDILNRDMKILSMKSELSKYKKLVKKYK